MEQKIVSMVEALFGSHYFTILPTKLIEVCALNHLCLSNATGIHLELQQSTSPVFINKYTNVMFNIFGHFKQINNSNRASL